MREASGVLVHLCSNDEWRTAQARGEHRPDSLDESGFVHLSTTEQVHLPANRLYAGRTDLVLLRIDPQKPMPVHTHRGREHTLVLAGGFTDEFGHFLRGDFSSTDPTVTHRPVADPGEPCICLAITTAPLRLTGRFARFLNPFLR